MTWVLLSTDLCVWVLVLAGLAYALAVRRRAHWVAPWRQVRAQPLAMSAVVVLALYGGIALLDSLHWRDRSGSGGGPLETEIVSALDVLLTPLRRGVETSYSAPLAVYGYARETVQLPGGGEGRQFVRLKFGGAGLSDPALEHHPDLRWRALKGVVSGAVLSLLLALWWWPQALRGRADPAGRAAACTLITLGVLLGLGVSLAHGYHVFGTDKVGNDVCYQVLKSVRTGLVIGTLTTLLTLPFALGLGVAAGYFGGVIDDLVQYLYSTLSSIPGVLLVAASALLLDGWMTRHAEAFTSLTIRADLRLFALCVILGITSWTSLCRLLRAEALKLRESDFVLAARGLGTPDSRVLWWHLLPNVMHVVLITTVLDFSGLVLAEAALTYINIGVDPGMESWGNMINAARLELAREPVVWWPLAAAMLSMFVLVLAANVLADAVREAFDPRLLTRAGGGS